MIVGHSVSTADGIILAIDESVADILQRTQKNLIGASYMAITHADDLARNVSYLAALQPDTGAIRIRKRYIEGEGGSIELDVEVARVGGRDSGFLIGTLSTIDPSEPATLPNGLARVGIGCERQTPRGHDRDPQRLWRRAKDLLEMARARDALLGWDLCADHAWTMLLLTYVAEAESRIASVSTIAADLHVSRSMIERWVRVLQSKRMLEQLPPGIDALQLTQFGIERVEQLLAEQSFGRVS